MNNLISKINKLLETKYPIETTFNDIHKLSHFYIESNNWNKFISIHFDINGKILNSDYKNYKIIKVITNKTLNWYKYLCLYLSFLNIRYNPCINENYFLILLHTYNYIDELNIKKIIIKKNNIILNIDINYILKPSHNLIWNSKIDSKNNINYTENHFIFNSFDVYNNHIQIKTELDRLIKNRDKYKEIHFHLDNNGGGDIVPAHLILRCLIGQKEKWMKNIKKILKNGEIKEWDCWKEEEKNSPNIKTVKKINLDILPNYETKYKGKIFLYMSKENGSASWFFITYLIYGFTNTITRFSKKCYGQTIKYGTIKSNQLKLIGHSGTTSGDGNSIKIKYNNIEILCPTEQFISSSIHKNDWNRYWIK